MEVAGPHFQQRHTLVTSVAALEIDICTTIFADRNYFLSGPCYYRISCVIRPFLKDNIATRLNIRVRYRNRLQSSSTSFMDTIHYTHHG